MSSTSNRFTEGKKRADLKSSTSSSQRKNMTERRCQMKTQLRKAKKSQLISLKRRCQSSTVPGCGKYFSSTTEFASATSGLGFASSKTNDTANEVFLDKLAFLASKYVERKDAESLRLFQEILASSNADSQSADSLLRRSGDGDANVSTAILLANTLASSLSGQNRTDAERLDASRVLTNLAAGESRLDEDEDEEANLSSIYGGATVKACNGWCGILARSQSLVAVVKTLSRFVEISNQNLSNVSPSALSLCEQCCWALGNIGGDSQRSRDAAHSAGAILPLVSAIRVCFYVMRNQSSSAVALCDTSGICRNAAWAISNLARGAETLASQFLAIGSTVTGFEGLLQPDDLGNILMSPELMAQMTVRNQTPSNGKGENAILKVTWDEVALEACWILAFLTSREDQAVEFLLTFTDGNNSNAKSKPSLLCQALAFRLSQASDRIILADNTNTPTHIGGTSFETTTSFSAENDIAARTCVPCIRAVGNIATACDGRHVAKLLTTYSITTPTTTITCSIADSLAKLIDNGSLTGIGESATLAPEAAWAAGTLLCDAGPPLPHPSTACAKILVPALCRSLISKMSKLELKREAASALWNAVASPPEPRVTTVDLTATGGSAMVSSSNNGEDLATLRVRNEILKKMAETEDVILSLTSLLTSLDMDAVYASIRIVDAIFRRISCRTIRKVFAEAGVLDALETVCDRVSVSYSDGNSLKWQGGGSSSNCADIAADLIDDFFEEDILGRDESEEGLDGPLFGNENVSSNVFQFGVNEGPVTSPVGGFDFSSTGELRNFTSNNIQSSSTQGGMGRGRGRGKTIPSWMQKDQSH